MATHHLDATQPYAFRDNTLAPRVRIQPDDTLVFDPLEASAPLITPASTSAALPPLRFDDIHR